MISASNMATNKSWKHGDWIYFITLEQEPRPTLWMKSQSICPVLLYNQWHQEKMAVDFIWLELEVKHFLWVTSVQFFIYSQQCGRSLVSSGGHPLNNLRALCWVRSPNTRKAQFSVPKSDPTSVCSHTLQPHKPKLSIKWQQAIRKFDFILEWNTLRLQKLSLFQLLGYTLFQEFTWWAKKHRKDAP